MQLTLILDTPVELSMKQLLSFIQRIQTLFLKHQSSSKPQFLALILMTSLRARRKSSTRPRWDQVAARRTVSSKPRRTSGTRERGCTPMCGKCKRTTTCRRSSRVLLTFQTMWTLLTSVKRGQSPHMQDPPSIGLCSASLRVKLGPKGSLP